MKPKLLILSDLWGFDNATWIKDYVELLKSDFHITTYDCCKLAEINKTNLLEEELHLQFINSGINMAVATLLRLEKEDVTVVAFSMGGTIAWKAALNGLKVSKLFAISSTRLRYEIEKPPCHIQLLFGEEDTFIPKNGWFKKLDLQPETIKKGLHEIYKDTNIIKRVCNQIKAANKK